jgi:uncharacterized protein YegP (UPF0339 family)
MTPSRRRSGVIWGMMFAVLGAGQGGASVGAPQSGQGRGQPGRVLKFETYQDARKEYRWRLKATNGQIIATSQGYNDKRDRDNSIERIKKDATKLTFETFEDARKEYRWRLKATNGQIIATSGQGYKDRRSCENAIDVIKKGAETARVEEATE